MNRRDSYLRTLNSIARSLEKLVELARDTNSGSPSLKLSGTRRAQLKLQGKYLGYMRQLSPSRKARVKALRVKKGYLPAIKLAREMTA